MMRLKVKKNLITILLLLLSFSSSAKDKIVVEKIDKTKVDQLKFITDSQSRIILLESKNGKKTYPDEVKEIQGKVNKVNFKIQAQNKEILNALKRVGGDGTGGGITLDMNLIQRAKVTGGDGTGGG